MSDSSLDWTSLLVEHERWLRRVLYARLGNSDEADDVLQEVALSLVRKQPELKDREKAPGYLYQMAVRQSLMYRRSIGRRRNMEQKYAEQSPDMVEASTYDPVDWLMANERRGQVRKALEQLAPRDREVLLLKHGENMSYREIANTTGTTVSAVEARLYRARGRLRSKLKELDVVSKLT